MCAALVSVAACSGASTPDPDSAGPTTTTGTDNRDAPVSSDAPVSTVPQTDPTTTFPAVEDGPLVDVCGESLVIQTSGRPSIGVGPLYALLGPSPAVDVDRQAVSGPLIRADGTVEDVDLELRSGGPGVGFRSPIAVMANDDTIDLAHASMAVAVRDRSTLSTSAVMSLTDRSHDAVIIDPATYPDISDIVAVGAQGIEVRHVTDSPVIRFLTATGALTSDQLVGGSDGGPASFVAAQGAIAQQGDLLIEPALLASLPQWGRPVTALPAADAGWLSLDDLLVADTESERLSDDCLGRLVPVVQSSIAAYVADPTPTNAVLGAIRNQFNPLDRLTPALLDDGTRLAVEAGVFDTSSNDVPGTIATDGLDAFLGELAAALDVEDVAVDELVDDRFVDPTVSR